MLLCGLDASCIPCAELSCLDAHGHGRVDLNGSSIPVLNRGCNEVAVPRHDTRSKEPECRRKEAQAAYLKDDVEGQVACDGNDEEEDAEKNPVGNATIDEG